MPKTTKRILGALLALAFVPVSLAVAAADAAPPPCPGPTVTGTVVGVDQAAHQVTVDTGAGGLCTVPLGVSESDHPIVELLGRYFGNVSLPALSDALADTRVWVVCPTPDTCQLAAADDLGALAGRVTAVSENPDGSFTLTVDLNGQTVTLTTTNTRAAQRLQAALARLHVDWQLTDGAVADASADIERLHDDGLGFGVIVKLYAMAAESRADCQTAAPPVSVDCGVSVDELVAAFRSGMGMGQLFKLYGKPDLLGVGQVRQAIRAADEINDSADDNDAPVGEVPGCQHGHAAQHNPHCTTVTPEADDSAGANNANDHGNGHGNGNSNGGGNGNGHGHGKP